MGKQPSNRPPTQELSEPYLKLDLDIEEGQESESVLSRDTPLQIGKPEASGLPKNKPTFPKVKESKKEEYLELTPLSPAALEEIELSMITRRGIHIKTSSLLALAFLILITSIGGIIGGVWILHLYLPKLHTPIAVGEKTNTQPDALETTKIIKELQEKNKVLTQAHTAQNELVRELSAKQQELIEKLEKHLHRRRNRHQEERGEKNE